MINRAQQRGITLVEIMVVVVILGIFTGGFIVLFTKNITFFKRMRVRQQVMLQSRTCIERIEQVLRNGRARTLVISTPTNPAPARPNSRADFELQVPLASGATAYSIHLEDGTVFGREYRTGQSPAPQPLASNVTGLMFTGDAMDPAIVSVSLQIDSPYDSSRNPPQAVTLIIPNRIVRMAEGP